MDPRAIGGVSGSGVGFAGRGLGQASGIGRGASVVGGGHGAGVGLTGAGANAILSSGLSCSGARSGGGGGESGGSASSVGAEVVGVSSHRGVVHFLDGQAVAAVPVVVGHVRSSVTPFALRAFGTVGG